jgi:uncharacterized protein YmfQ (DUF2313 family)
MGMSASDYFTQLQSLLPLGIAWPREPDANLSRLLAAWADELARVEDRAGQLMDEVDPRSTNELLTDWERVCGLPNSCVVAALDDLDPALRRGAVVAHLTAMTDLSVSDYVRLAREMGFEITVTEFDLHDVTLDVDALLTAPPWQYAWRVSAPATTVFDFSVMDTVADPLAWWSNVVLECVLRALKPAHTTIIFAYQTE